ncbi:MAG TPA: hypothetical protein VKV17_02690 [Bryobacteraceae bacterium]|nr:hypothetical protein [Bryobacteraceae bacterium]
MLQSVEGPAIDQRASANPGAYGDIQEIADSLPRSPAGLAQCGGVDVGIETGGQLEGAADRAGQIEIPPGALGSGGDVAVCRRAGMEIDRAERADSDGRESGPRAEEGNHGVQGGFRSSGGNDAAFQILRTGSDGAHKLRSSGFDCSENGRLR